MEDYKPSISDKLFKRTDKKVSLIYDNISNAKSIDQEEYRDNLNKYENDLKEWNDIRDLASKIIGANIEGYGEAIKQVEPLKEISDIGSQVEFNIFDSKVIAVTLFVNSDDVIPSEEKSILKSGKLSVKQMNKSKFNELYQDYIYSCVLRVARELFALLPIENVFVTTIGELLNTNTGHIEGQPILSVNILRKTLNKLNLDMIDPSDSMKNFVHNMAFKRTVGFNAVEELPING